MKPNANVPVAFEVLADSGVREGMTSRGPVATVVFSIAWGDRYAFVNAVCGKSSGGPGSILRTLPLSYPPSPNLVALPDAQIEPIDGKLQANTEGGGWWGYTRAKVTISFGVPEWSIGDAISGDQSDPSGVPWTTTTFDVGGEFLTLPDSAYTFPGGKAVTAPVGRLIPQINITFKRHWVPYLPVAVMVRLIGKLNAADFAIGDSVFPAETLLFLGGPNERTADSDGQVVQNVSYKMTYRPISWNKFLHPDGASGFQYLTDKTGKKVYETDDFTILP